MLHGDLGPGLRRGDDRSGDSGVITTTLRPTNWGPFTENTGPLRIGMLFAAKDAQSARAKGCGR
jgi:hypothetical protein